jgi:hypothetical protein
MQLFGVAFTAVWEINAWGYTVNRVCIGLNSNDIPSDVGLCSFGDVLRIS